MLREHRSKKIDIFLKELTPRLRTYELRGQGKKMTNIKTYKHLTLFYKNYLQKRHTSPSVRHWIKGTYVEKKSTFFKELTPRLRTYELRGQGKKITNIKTNKHLTLSYKNYLQKRHTSPSVRHWIKGTYVEKNRHFLKNWHPICGPMSFMTKGKKMTKIKTNKHLTLSYKNYLQKRHTSP